METLITVAVSATIVGATAYYAWKDGYDKAMREHNNLWDVAEQHLNDYNIGYAAGYNAGCKATEKKGLPNARTSERIN